MKHDSGGMKRRRWSLLVVGLIVVLTAGSAGAGPRTSASVPSLAPFGGIEEQADYVPGELIVRFRSDATVAERSAALSGESARVASNLGLPGLARVKLPLGASVPDAAAALESDPHVLYAEPNYLNELSVLPNDPMFGRLWGLSQPSDADIDAPSAWNRETGSSNVVVAVVDSGLAYGHPDLNGNVWTNPGETPGNGLDDDGNGFVDDVRGWDFVQDDAAPLDFLGHGTHVAGTIGAEGNNGTGVTGVNWDVSIMPVRAAGVDGSLTDAAIIQAFDYACDNGADVVNGSFGSSRFSFAIADAITAGACADTLFVFAAGNSGRNLNGNTGVGDDTFPCELHRPPAGGGVSAANVLCVGASGKADGIASFSNRGTMAVHLAAPGVGIRSTLPTFAAVRGFPEGFEGPGSSFDNRWGIWMGLPRWDRTRAKDKGGKRSLTDSPGRNYPNNANNSIRRRNAFSLEGRTGCGLEYDLWLQSQLDHDGIVIDLVQPFDDVAAWSGSTGGRFLHFFEDLSDHDGDASVRLRFRFLSDGSVRGDGAYVDNVLVACLARSAARYGNLSGTSMATPHVAGAAALLLADDPTMTVADLKAAILGSVDVVGGLAGHVQTSGRLNAAGALGLVPDDTGPDTTITRGPSGRTTSHRARFGFTGSEADVRFQCKHMSAPWRACESPKTYRGLGNGRHAFRVRALDTNGNVDPTPATRSWRIV